MIFKKTTWVILNLLFKRTYFSKCYLCVYEVKQLNLPHTSRKKNNKEDKRLFDDIEFLESIQDQTGKNSTLLKDKRLKLQKLRDNKVKGQMVRAHLKWLHQGEKPVFSVNWKPKVMLIKPSKEYKPMTALLSQNKVKYYKKCKNFTVNFLITRTILFYQWLLQKYLNCSILKKLTIQTWVEKFQRTNWGKH